MRRVVVLLILLAAARPAMAQDPPPLATRISASSGEASPKRPSAAQAGPPHQHPSSDAWQWGVEGNVFAGYNYQLRKFTDFDEVESQNWLMTSLSKVFNGGSSVQFVAMFSLAIVMLI